MRGDPMLVPAAIEISARTVAKIRQNLFWAFAYNMIGIPLAAAGLLSPVIAGAAMAMSSVSVMANALLLSRWSPRSAEAHPAEDAPDASVSTGNP
jgi:Cu+-exporting ATPase